MHQTIFFTGFPGFLGTELISRLLPSALEPIQALCLVQKKFRAQAEKSRDALYSKYPLLHGRIEFVEGDITAPDLGGQVTSKQFDSITQIFHLAAVYDLSVKAEIAHLINVVGTEHVLALADRCKNLKHFHHVSTCYVSGKFSGTFTELDLDRGQAFNNHYEETKFLSEKVVQLKMSEGFPATIYRPAVVVGNSKTGETQKYDGPYFVMQWLLRQPKFAVMPMIGNPKEHTLNVVPSDFVIDAMTFLSQHENSIGKVFQLADLNPLTIDEIVTELGRVTQRHLIRVPLPLALAKGALDFVPGVESLMRIPSSTLDYFVHPTNYDCTLSSEVLSKGGIRAPSFRSYSQVLVDFMKAHPDLRTQAMK